MSASQPHLSIAAVERDTGIGKDTLRVWERRYGFPQPERDAFDERSYPLAQVEKLRTIKRLLDQGFRPGKVVAMPLEDLQRISMAEVAMPRSVAAISNSALDLHLFMDRLHVHDLAGLREHLHQAVIDLGPAKFVTALVAPLSALVGETWMRGELEVFEEHLFTECVTTVLRQTIYEQTLTVASKPPVVLLTTFPQEQHALGLLMAECMLALNGCRCIPMGVQMPVADIAKAAHAHQVDLVALSFSSSVNANHVLDGLKELRHLLPANTAIWAGGGNAVLQRRPPEGGLVVNSLEAVAQSVQTWRDLHG
jgi:DNA-binding transcriptional MerR regulator/methylmalonyl-CoA mutase cobalamin-binding subunit